MSWRGVILGAGIGIVALYVAWMAFFLTSEINTKSIPDGKVRRQDRADYIPCVPNGNRWICGPERRPMKLGDNVIVDPATGVWVKR